MRRGSGFIMGEMFRKWRSEQIKYTSPTGKVHNAEKPFKKMNGITRKMVRNALKAQVRAKRINDMKGLAEIYSKPRVDKYGRTRWERRQLKNNK